MNTRADKVLRLALLLSFILGAPGLLMTIDAFYKRLSVEAAAGQAEYLKHMPFFIENNSAVSAPVYHKNLTLENYGILSGKIYGSLYDSRPSLKEARIAINRGYAGLSVSVILDARVRR
ncbi:MAG TPA: hypothetical protein ENN43_08160 [bacterium]|nr:hypothetical protein [bacterium]